MGFVGGITSALKSFVKGEINEMTQLIYAARENALGMITQEAKAIGADDVVGVKTYVYQLGNGLIEFLAIGTAVKKSPHIKTESEQLIPQAMIVDQDTFYDSVNADSFAVDVNKGATPPMNRGLGAMIIPLLIVAFFVFVDILWRFVIR